MTPGHMSLKRVTPASKAVSEGFREEVTQKLPLKDAQDLNMSSGFREECCLWAEVWKAGSNHVGVESSSLCLLMITLRMERVDP